MRTAIIALLLSLFMLGCATEAKYQKVLDSWLGEKEQSLVGAWGVPASVYETDDFKFLTYLSSEQVFIPGTPPSYQTTYGYGTSYTTPAGGTSPMLIGLKCQTTFKVIKSTGLIANWSYRGNNCVSK